MKIDFSNIDIKEVIKEYTMLVAGIFLVAIGVVVFYEPNNLVTGGISGIAIIIGDMSERLYGVYIPLWLTNIVLNIPLFILAFIFLGGKFLGKTLFSTVFFSLCLSLAEFIPKVDSDLIISTLLGAAVCGVGSGLIFKCRATTGGTDLIASLIHKYHKHISIAKILFVIDAATIVCGFIVFGPNITFYAILAVFVTSKLTDNVLDGFDFAKAAFIISDKSDEIGQKFMEDTERGATFLHAQGVYTGKEKNVLLVVMDNKEIVVVKDLVKKIDPSAFVIVTDVREVLGEGFQRII